MILPFSGLFHRLDKRWTQCLWHHPFVSDTVSKPSLLEAVLQMLNQPGFIQGLFTCSPVGQLAVALCEQNNADPQHVSALSRIPEKDSFYCFGFNNLYSKLYNMYPQSVAASTVNIWQQLTIALITLYRVTSNTPVLPCCFLRPRL